MTIGDLTLSPTFDPEVYIYTASTTDATNKVNAVTDDISAVITITLTNSEETEGLVVANGKPVTWASGTNTLTIEVEDGAGSSYESTTYTVTVTKS